MAASGQAVSRFGDSVSSAGDIDFDGYDDVIVGAMAYDYEVTNSGRAFVFCGSSSGLISLPEWTAQGEQPSGYFSKSVSTAGDVNGDGCDDIIIGAWQRNTQFERAGRAYVYHGSKRFSPPEVNAGENIQILSEEQTNTIIQGTATDKDGDTLEFRWLEGEQVLLSWNPVSSNGGALLDLGALPIFPIGNHTLILEVREGEYGVSIPDEMVLTIQNSPPEVQPAPSHQVVDVGTAPIVVIADASDFDGDTVSYEWLKGSDVLASGAVATQQGGDRVPIPDLNIPAGDSRFPLGNHVIDLKVNDGVNPPVTVSVTVEMTDSTAPSLSPIPGVTILWPPNHDLHPILIQANASDNGGGAIDLDVAVESSELPDADGDGNTIPDFYIDSVDDATGFIDLRLRSERAGKGDGRTYTVTITATDTSGNASEATLEIIAPHDKRKK